MDLKNIIGAAALVVASSAAMATPQYSGNTYGDLDPLEGASAGYYIWNDVSSPSDWHIRWTAAGADIDPVSWAGNIQFYDSNLGTTSEFQFEASGIYADSSDTAYDSPFISGGDGISWSAATNNSGGVDGIDFTLSSSLELMAFSLGSDLFADLQRSTVDPGVVSQMIYIGSGLSSTNVLVVENGGMVYQQFEISVPEPATIALFGIGLLGLGAAARRQKALQA